MKSFSYLIVLSLAVNLLGCKNQNQVKQNERLTTVSESEELVFGDKKLTYFIEGQCIPCIVCADGNIQAYCLSDNLKENFQFVFTEPRHGTYYDEPKDYSGISMDTIVDDIEILRKKLKYDKIYVLGHSICGLIALEYARKYPQNTYGAIMINTPPHFHKDYMDIVSTNWEAKASEGRKAIYEMNNDQLKKMNLDSLNEVERSILEEKASVPMKWRDSLYNISPIIINYRLNAEGWNHFFSMMQDYDIARSEVKVPIFLSLGSYDFIVPQSLWGNYIDKFSSMTVYHFKRSGHFPQVEEQELFDKQLLDWKAKCNSISLVK
jgi:proline iminopeptidase